METTEFESVQHAFPCQQCGAQLQYREGSQQLACGHCGHQHDIVLSREPIVEYDFHSTLKHLPGGAPDAISLSVKCHACSAEFEFDADLHADECPFCGSKIVVDAQQHRIIQPKALLPRIPRTLRLCVLALRLWAQRQLGLCFRQSGEPSHLAPQSLRPPRGRLG